MRENTWKVFAALNCVKIAVYESERGGYHRHYSVNLVQYWRIRGTR